MWVAVTFAAIAVTGTAFMVWFLLGLLHECASVCYWVVPARRRREKHRHLAVLRGIYAEEDCRAPEGKRSDYYVELLENEVYAKECVSGLIALDIRPVSTHLGWRSIWSRRDQVFHERRF
jgi:hypothetical protein